MMLLNPQLKIFFEIIPETYTTNTQNFPEDKQKCVLEITNSLSESRLPCDKSTVGDVRRVGGNFTLHLN
jgi:hypothetical protein